MIKKTIILFNLILPVFMNYSACQNIEPIPLFNKFPKLKEKIAYVSLGDFPTPIQKWIQLGNVLGNKNIFVKRDDLSGKKQIDGTRLFGGNKIRKLEFLLADALNKNAKKVVTYGCAGSNHALSTAICAKHVGLKSILMLKAQPNSKLVQNNLLLDLYYGAEIYYFPDDKSRTEATQKLIENDNQIYFIPTGGSVPLGVIGFVNSIFELNDQIKSEKLKEPDYIYVAMGSCGTTAGLLLGIQSLGLKTKIVAITVEPEEHTVNFLAETKRLFNETNQLLNSLDNNFPLVEFAENQLIINKNFCGKEYGLFTEEGIKAIELLEKTEDIVLDGTYTAKAMAALIFDITNNVRKPEDIILFWNTYCGINFSDLIKSVNYNKLPVEFHKYFD